MDASRERAVAQTVNRPAVTVGMPVYNGERWLRPALDSLLAQTFRDFELVISDNGSSDSTQAICEEYAARDTRIRYVRQLKNRGAVFNWNFVANEARADLFKWASANDVCAPTMLEDCIAALREDPSLVLCYGTTALMDDDGVELRIYEGDPSVTERSASRRFVRIVTELAMNNAQAGVIRTEALRRTRLEPEYQGGDLVLMSELALLGGYRRLPQVLLHRRVGSLSFTSRLDDRQLAAFLSPDPSRFPMAMWRRMFGYITAVLRAPVALTEKLSAIGFLGRYFYWNQGRLWNEIASAVRR